MLPVEVNDYRFDLFRQLDMGELDKEVDLAMLAWVESDRELFEAIGEVNRVEESLLALREDLDNALTEEELKALDARSAAERAAKKERHFASTNRRYREMRDIELPDAKEDLRSAKVAEHRASKELDHVRSKRSSRDYRVRLLSTMARIPAKFAPDPDGIVPSRAEVVSAARAQDPTNQWIETMLETDWESPAAVLALEVLPEGIDPSHPQVMEILEGIQACRDGLIHPQL